MNRNSPVLLLIALIGIALAPVSHLGAQGASTTSQPSALGTLTGTVRNSATGRTLEGARVFLQGANREVFTDEQGTFRFTNVPPGQAMIEVTYTGLDTVSMAVAVGAGM